MKYQFEKFKNKRNNFVEKPHKKFKKSYKKDRDINYNKLVEQGVDLIEYEEEKF